MHLFLISACGDAILVWLVWGGHTPIVKWDDPKAKIILASNVRDAIKKYQEEMG